MAEDNPLGLGYTPTINDAVQGVVDYGGAVARFYRKAIPEFFTNVRRSIKEEAETPVPVTDTINPLKFGEELVQGVSKIESQVLEPVAQFAENLGAPEALAGGIAFGVGMILPGPSAGSIRMTRVGKQFPEVAEQASRYMGEAESYLKQTGSLKGYPRFVDPKGVEYLPRPKGKKPGGEPRLAMSPKSVKEAYTKTRKGRDVTSDSFEAFQRAEFNRMVKQGKSDLIGQLADTPSYVEHNRRLSSPFWKTARAKGQKPGDVDNLTQLFDLDFKKFKDKVDSTLDRMPNSPVDAFYDPLTESIVVENVKTGKQLGIIDPSKGIKEQLNRYVQKTL